MHVRDMILLWYTTRSLLTLPAILSGFKFSQLEMSASSSNLSWNVVDRNRCALVLAEVVLSVLLKSFRFSPSNKEIVWNLSPVKYPTVGRESSRPSMPMKVELLKEKVA